MVVRRCLLSRFRSVNLGDIEKCLIENGVKITVVDSPVPSNPTCNIRRLYESYKKTFAIIYKPSSGRVLSNNNWLKDSEKLQQNGEAMLLNREIPSRLHNCSLSGKFPKCS